MGKTASRIEECKLHFNNGHECGTVTWDKTWNKYTFKPREGCSFTPAWLKDIAATIEKMEDIRR